jgi:XFP-like protein
MAAPQHAPSLKVRVVNVVDLMCLTPPLVHPHDLEEAKFLELFTESKPVVFAFHGYQRAVHQIIHGRTYAWKRCDAPIILRQAPSWNGVTKCWTGTRPTRASISRTCRKSMTGLGLICNRSEASAFANKELHSQPTGSER